MPAAPQLRVVNIATRRIAASSTAVPRHSDFAVMMADASALPYSGRWLTDATGRRHNCSGPTTSAEDQREAAALRRQAQGKEDDALASAEALSALLPVVVGEGTFKYVLIRVGASTGEQRYLVRGTVEAAYHKDVALPYVNEYLQHGFEVTILGGGRIFHDPQKRLLRIYGFSYGFPWVEGAGNEISGEVCKEAFPDYHVEWSDDGY